MDDQYKQLAKSPKIYDISDQIGNELGLHIDQIGEIDSAIRSILFGDTDSRDFVKNIQRRLECDTGMAVKISKRVNELVFSVIKELLQNEHEVGGENTQTVQNVNDSINTNQKPTEMPSKEAGVNPDSINLIQKKYDNNVENKTEKKEVVPSVQSVITTPPIIQKEKTDLEKVGQFDLEHDGHAPEMHQNDLSNISEGHETEKADGITFEKNYTHDSEELHLPKVSSNNPLVEAVPNQLIGAGEKKKVEQGSSIVNETTTQPYSPQIITPSMEKTEKNKVTEIENTVSIPPKYEKKSYSSDPYREPIE